MMNSYKDEWNKYLVTMETLLPVLKDNEANFVSGCGGSVDVVHLNGHFTCYPAVDVNRAFGKKNFLVLHLNASHTTGT